MRDPAMERQARVMNIAAVLAMEAIERGQWDMAHRALTDLSLLTLRLRTRVSPRVWKAAPPNKCGNVLQLANVIAPSAENRP